MGEPLPFDPYKIEKVVRAKTKEDEDKLKRLSAAYKALFDSPDGRIVYKDLMDRCMTFETTMTGNSWTYFNEGKRAIGLHILLMREKGVESELRQMREETYRKL
jgi:hypothetical protein